MRWQRTGPCAFTSEDGRYTINVAPQPGFEHHGEPVVFMLVDGKTILGTERFIHNADDLLASDSARRDAQRALLALHGLLQ